MQPADLEVAVGEVAILGCSPPVGHPEPNVTWRKDGVAINSSDQHYTVRAPALATCGVVTHHQYSSLLCSEDNVIIWPNGSFLVKKDNRNRLNLAGAFLLRNAQGWPTPGGI